MSLVQILLGTSKIQVGGGGGGGCVQYTKEKQLYQNLVPSGHTLLTFCIRIGTFDFSRVSGLVQVLRVSCIIVTSVRVQRANIKH